MFRIRRQLHGRHRWGCQGICRQQWWRTTYWCWGWAAVRTIVKPQSWQHISSLANDAKRYWEMMLAKFPFVPVLHPLPSHIGGGWAQPPFTQGNTRGFNSACTDTVWVRIPEISRNDCGRLYWKSKSHAFWRSMIWNMCLIFRSLGKSDDSPTVKLQNKKYLKSPEKVLITSTSCHLGTSSKETVMLALQHWFNWNSKVKNGLILHPYWMKFCIFQPCGCR